MARIRTKPGVAAFSRYCTDQVWREITPDWQDMDDALITDAMRARYDIEIEASKQAPEDTPAVVEVDTPVELTVKTTRRRGRK